VIPLLFCDVEDLSNAEDTQRKGGKTAFSFRLTLKVLSIVPNDAQQMTWCCGQRAAFIGSGIVLCAFTGKCVNFDER
jgi:hypothetical protein